MTAKVRTLRNLAPCLLAPLVRTWRWIARSTTPLELERFGTETYECDR
jgi:hypothetical protein